MQWMTPLTFRISAFLIAWPCGAHAQHLDPAAATPPVAKKIPKSSTIHGETWHDDYFWLREKTNSEVLAYLNAENAYAEAVLKPTVSLQEKLYSEMLGRIKETDDTVPAHRGNYWYYSPRKKASSIPSTVARKVASTPKRKSFLTSTIWRKGRSS